MAPRLGNLPPAAGEKPTAEAVDAAAELEPLLAVLPARGVRQIRLALRAFEWLPFPWRFSRASLEARQDFLARSEDSGSAIKRDLTLFLKVLTGLGYANDARVQAAVGYRSRCEVGDQAPAARSTASRRSGIWRPRASRRSATSSSSAQVPAAP